MSRGVPVGVVRVVAAFNAPGCDSNTTHRALRRPGGLADDASERWRTRATRSATSRALGASVPLVDKDRQFFKSCLGLPEPWASRRGSPLTHSFCQHAVAAREPLLVSDAREHDVLRTNLAIRDMGVIDYAGIPLIHGEGHALGTLCVIDSQPLHWTANQIQRLSDIAASVVTEITLALAAARTLTSAARARGTCGCLGLPGTTQV